MNPPLESQFLFQKSIQRLFSQEGAEQLLSKVEIYLNELSDDNESEEREMLLLSRTLLQSCLGLTEDSDMELDPDILRSPSDIEYALIAVRLFNTGKYLEAIQACESFFQMNTDKSGGVSPDTNNSGRFCIAYTQTNNKVYALKKTSIRNKPLSISKLKRWPSEEATVVVPKTRNRYIAEIRYVAF